MTAWIASIVAIVALGVLLDIIMPEGEINKYIKSVFSIVTVVAIIAPLPAMLGGKGDFNNYFDKLDNITIDQSYVDSVDKDRQRVQQARLDDLIANSDYSRAIGKLVYDNDGSIKKIEINLEKIVIKDEAEHKDIVDKLTTLITKAFAVKKECVYVYGYK